MNIHANTKINKAVTRTSSPLKSTRRLLAYTSAASVGAFAMAHSANADVIFRDFATDPLMPGSDNSIQLDLDNNGSIDAAAFYNTSTTRFQFSLNPNLSGTLLGPGSPSENYYVNSFSVGDEIGPSTSLLRDDTAGVIANGKFQTENEFAGLSFKIGNNDHFAWIEMQITDRNTGQFQIPGYAYESQANVPITVVPEPSTYAFGLGLLALGAAGLRIRRRQAKLKALETV